MGKFNLRQRPRVSYFEPDDPNLDEYIFCEQCADYVYEYCSIHGPLLVIPDDKIYDGNNKPSHVIDAADANKSNWMRYVNCARHWGEQNLVAFQYQGQLYYRTIKIIPRFTELMVYYGSECANSLQVDLRRYNAPPQYARKFGAPVPKKPISEPIKKKSERSLSVEQSKHIESANYNTNNIKDISRKPDVSKVTTEKNAVAEDKNNNVIENNVEKYICNECGQQFDKKKSIEVHVKMNHERKKKDLYFHCKKCSYSTVTKEGLEKHSRFHDETRKFVCELCQFRFSFRSNIRSHKISCNIKNNNSKIRPSVEVYSCSECNKNFSYKHNMVTHLRTHTGEKPFSCTECDQRFSGKNTLVAHLRTHTGEKPFSCTECNQRFNRKSHLVTHLRKHTGEKPFSCTECDKRFNEKGTLIRHLRTHTGEKPFSCTECDQRFNRKSHLVTHLRTHTGEKPFSCTECHKRFSQINDLRRHLRTHTGEKPFSCTECNQRFGHKSSLVKHLRTQHTHKKP